MKVEIKEDGSVLFFRQRGKNKDMWKRNADGTWLATSAVVEPSELDMSTLKPRNPISVPAEVLAKLRELGEKQ